MTPHAMTRHLTPEELIDSRERPLPPARQAHADTCAACRSEIARLDEVLLDVGAVDVPEPSPLFWDHLSARIRDRVAHEPPPTRGREHPLARLTDWLMGWGSAPRWAYAAILLVLCASLGWLGWSQLRHGGERLQTSNVPSPQGNQGDDNAARTAAAAAGAVDPAFADTSAVNDEDDEWTLMVQMAEDVSWDDAQGSPLDGEGSSLYVRPAAVDRALIELTAEERDRLVQLVKADLARQKS
jgi:hypothetical protein